VGEAPVVHEPRPGSINDGAAGLTWPRSPGGPWISGGTAKVDDLLNDLIKIGTLEPEPMVMKAGETIVEWPDSAPILMKIGKTIFELLALTANLSTIVPVPILGEVSQMIGGWLLAAAVGSSIDA